MLRELVEAAGRFDVAPAGYKRRRLDRVIEILQDGQVELRQPTGDGFRELDAPDRQRSGKTTRANVKPFLLVDDAEYVLGIGGPEARIKHEAYVALLRDAAKDTGDGELSRIAEALGEGKIEAQGLDRKETLGVRCYPSHDFAVERKPVKDYWAKYLEKEYCAQKEAPCLCCGRSRRPVKTLPNEVVVQGQKCQMLSFDDSAFRSFGKNQTENAALCFECASAATQTVRFLCGSPLHRATVATDTTKGKRRNPLRNQLAVFWLRRSQQVESPSGEIDLEAWLGAALSKPEETNGLPAPELAQLEALVRVPWVPREGSLRLEPNSFYLAILSANKARLVVRDWIAVSADEVRRHLADYLDAIGIIDRQGQRKLLLPIPVIIDAMRSANPSLSRGLLRTAYEGYPPRPALLQAAVWRLRLPEMWNGRDQRKRRKVSDEWILPALVAAVKLVLTYGREAKKFVELNQGTEAPAAYLCGRLLAIGEEAQRRASRGRVNTTVVDRLYGTASVSPGFVLPMLVRRIETAYLPKIRKTGRGYRELQEGLEEIAQGIERGGGFRAVLKIEEQGWFALGFYHQRSEFRKPRTEQSGADGETGERK